MGGAQNKKSSIRRILCIKFSSIGDIVLTTSPIQSLRSIFPAATIDILTLSNFAPLLENNKYIDKIIQFDKKLGLNGLIKIGNNIKKSNYDLIIDFHNSLRSKIVRIFLWRIPKKHLKKPYLKRFLLFRLRKNYFSADFNQIQLLHQPIRQWLKKEKFPTPELFVTNYEEKVTKIKLSESDINQPPIVLIPSAAWIQKTWPADKYQKLIANLGKRKKIDFILLGAKNDDICSDIAEKNSSILNLQGKTNLREALAIIAVSKFVIGGDTGLVHSAEALGKKVVMILGPTSRETGAGVNREGSVVVENNTVWCRPCSQTGKRKCYRSEQFCMNTIKPENVLEIISKNGLL